MEPVSLLLAGGAMALYAQRRHDNLSANDENKRQSLSVFMSAPISSEEFPVVVIAVHIRRVRISPHFLGERLKLRVKVGEPGNSTKCDTPTQLVEPPPRPVESSFVAHVCEPSHQDAFLDFGTTCFFLGSKDDLRVGSVPIRFRLMRVGIFGGVLAKASFRSPPDCDLASSLVYSEMPFEISGGAKSAGGWRAAAGRSESALGTLEVGVGINAVGTGKLRAYLQSMGAHAQSDALTLNATVVRGAVVNEMSAGATQHHVQGQAVSLRSGESHS
jgi:hypothetical protein